MFSDNNNSGDSGNSGGDNPGSGGDSGDSGDSGNDSTNKTYALTVSGFTGEYADANGDYWDTGETSAGQPIYYNGKKYLLKGEFVGGGDDNFWGFCDNNTVESVDFFSSGSDVTAITTWYDDGGAIEITGVTVKPYEGSDNTGDSDGGDSGNSGGDNSDSGDNPSSGDSGSSDGRTYVYTVSGAGDADANGNYYDSGMTDSAEHHIYTNDKCNLCLWLESSDSNGYRWIITSIADEQELYMSYTIGEPTMSLHFWGVASGTAPAPTVTEYAGDNSGDNTGDSDDSGDSGSSDGRTYVYIVRGAGDTAANGNYYDSGETHDGFPVYTNGNYYLFYYSADGWWVLDTDLTPSFMYYTDTMPAGSTWRAIIGIVPAPFVMEYSGGSSSGSGDDKTYVYTVSGFGMEDVNGNYYDSGEKNIVGQPIYTNGKVALSNDDTWRWHFHSLGQPSNYEAFYFYDNILATTPIGSGVTGWGVGVGSQPIGTVTAYEGGDNNG